MKLLLKCSQDDPVDPHHFVTVARLDIVVKLMFFERLAHGLHDRNVVRTYCMHIQGRTGGREKRSWKTSVSHYLEAANALVDSMGRDGFDPDQPVELGSNLNLRGGAHRIACALALNVPVHVRIAHKPGNAAVWDAVYMRSRRMSCGCLAPVLERLGGLQFAARLRLG